MTALAYPAAGPAPGVWVSATCVHCGALLELDDAPTNRAGRHVTPTNPADPPHRPLP